jgi:hypothetical protein
MVDTRTLDLLVPAHLRQRTLEIQAGSAPNLSTISLDNGLMEVNDNFFIFLTCLVVSVNFY